jgi:hypothetical protein
MRRYTVAILGGFSASILFMIMGYNLVDLTIPLIRLAPVAIFSLVGCFLYAVYQQDSKEQKFQQEKKNDGQ